MSTETQAREVEVDGDKYRVSGDAVHIYFPPGATTGWVSNEKLEAAIRRIAELEEERERVRELLDMWASRAHRWTQQGGDGDDVSAILSCCDEIAREDGTVSTAETRLDMVLRSFVERRSKTYDNGGPMASGYVLCSVCGATYDRAVVHKPGCIVPRLLALADRIVP